jgi:hypothetical protein
MKLQHSAALGLAAASVFAVGVMLAAQDRFTLQAPNGIAFSEFKGYEAWQLIAPSQPDTAGGCGSSPAPGCIKAILGNPTMIKAHNDGIPANGKPVPDGAVMAKLEWTKKSTKAPPYALTEPGKLQQVSFMVKDSNRFPSTDGWGYATFKYEDTSGDWKAFGDSPTFANTCHACHTIVKARDFVFTAYPQR